MITYKTIDLFAGIGGIRRGFEMTGRFTNVLSSEIDKYACETYQHLFGENPFNDVTSETFKREVEFSNYDILLGGFPCQAFSIAGKKDGFKDKTRGTLFFDVADIIERTRPRAFLLENVRGLLSHCNGQTFRTIIDILAGELKYDVIGVNAEEELFGTFFRYAPASFTRNTRDFGLPQNRPRVFLMGFDRVRYGEKTSKMPEQALPIRREGAPIYEDLNDLLEFHAAPKYYLSDSMMSFLKRHRAKHEAKGNGFGYIVVNSPEIKHPYSNAILATGGSGKERNLVYDPQELPKELKKNTEGIRIMTPREWGKLQGFINYAFLDSKGEDCFSFPTGISDIQQYKMFGNSVSIPVIFELAKMMLRNLDYLDA